MTRLEHRGHTPIAFGELVQPIRRLLYESSNPKADLPFVRSRFETELHTFSREVNVFSHIGY